MPRRVEDIVPNSHRSIRDISVERNSVTAPIQPPKERKSAPRARPSDMRSPTKTETPQTLPVRVSGSTKSERPLEETKKHLPLTPPTHHKKKSRSKKWLYIVMGVVVVVAGVAYVASVYFSHASFTIVPKVVPITVNGTYISQNSSSKGDLTYELGAVKGNGTVTIPAVDGPKVSTSAKGKITLYNAYSSQSQRLIAGTRLSDDTGRIYRLASSVVIPGYTTSAGANTPGTVSVSITADEPGQSYNISRSDTVSDFKIVAYKGSAKYTSIYGRLTTDVSGGFVGTQKVVSPGLMASSTVELQNRITANLLAQVQSTVPDGYILYPKAYVTSFGSPVVTSSDTKSAVVTLQGTLYGIIFKKTDLVTRVAGEQAIAAFDGFAYDTVGLESLDFSIANLKDFSPEKKNTLIIKLKGDAELVGTIPVDTLKTKLAGLSLAETVAVFRAYKPVIEIDKSSGEITPPWSKVPSDLGRISVKVLTK